MRNEDKGMVTRPGNSVSANGHRRAGTSQLPADQADLRGKVALILHGATRPGRELALAFARNGMDVAITFRSENEARAWSIHQAVEEIGQRCLLFHDRRNYERFIQSVVATITRIFGRPDVFISTGGGGDGDDHTEALVFPYLTDVKTILREIVEQRSEDDATG